MSMQLQAIEWRSPANFELLHVMPTVTYIDKTKWESSRFDSQLNSAPKPCRNNSQLRTKVERPERPLKNFKSNVRVCWGWGEIGVCFYKKKNTHIHGALKLLVSPYT